MRGAVGVWGAAGARLWQNLPRLIVVGALWLVASWPLLTVGAVTLAVYAWLRRAVLEVEDERAGGAAVPDEPYPSLPRFLRRLWWPGTVWAGLNLLLVPGVTLALGAARTGTLGGTVLAVLAAYLAWFWLALQPFFLDALAEGKSVPGALAESGRIVLAYPAYSHLCALPPLLLAGLGWWFSSLWPVLGVAAALLYWACVATGDPAPRRRPPVRDVL